MKRKGEKIEKKNADKKTGSVLFCRYSAGYYMSWNPWNGAIFFKEKEIKEIYRISVGNVVLSIYGQKN